MGHISSRSREGLQSREQENKESRSGEPMGKCGSHMGRKGILFFMESHTLPGGPAFVNKAVGTGAAWEPLRRRNGKGQARTLSGSEGE